MDNTKTNIEMDKISNLIENSDALNQIIESTYAEDNLDIINKVFRTSSSENKNEIDEIKSIEKEDEETKVQDLINKYEPLLKSLIELMVKGHADKSKHVIKVINGYLNLIDNLINSQLNEVMHHKKFQKLESSWRGLKYLVSNTEMDRLLKLKVMSCSKKEILKDKENAVDYDQSELYKKIYSLGIAAPGAHPFGAIIGDFEFSHNLKDIEFLKHISGISAVAHSPFISAASHKLFGINSYSELNEPVDLQMIFESKEYTKWNELRKTEDSRYVTLTLPRFLLRMPYGEEIDDDTISTNYCFKEESAGNHSNYLWGNAAYALGVNINDSFFCSGWFTQIYGEESGGLVRDLPLHRYITKKGNEEEKCPTECVIPEERAREFSNVGFMPLSHYQNSSNAVYYAAQTLNWPKKYDMASANESALLSSQLHRMLCISRFSIYLKSMLRGKLGSFTDENKLKNYLDKWLAKYVLANADQIDDAKQLAKRPLKRKVLSINKVEGKNGTYETELDLSFHDQLEQISVSIRLAP